MTKRGGFFMRLAAITLVFLPATGAVAKDQGWINNSLSLGVTKKLTLKITQESRYAEAIYFGNPFFQNIQLGPVYKLPADFYVALLYKREIEEKSSLTSHENRVTYEGGWKRGVTDDLKFDARVRLESRDFEERVLEDHIRYRVRFRFTYRLETDKLKLAPFIATEPFGDDKGSTDDFVNRNRFYVGTGVPVSERVTLVVNYMRQDTKNKETIHALNTGIELKL